MKISTLKNFFLLWLLTFGMAMPAVASDVYTGTLTANVGSSSGSQRSWSVTLTVDETPGSYLIENDQVTIDGYQVTITGLFGSSNTYSTNYYIPSDEELYIDGFWPYNSSTYLVSYDPSSGDIWNGIYFILTNSRTFEIDGDVVTNINTNYQPQTEWFNAKITLNRDWEVGQGSPAPYFTYTMGMSSDEYYLADGTVVGPNVHVYARYDISGATIQYATSENGPWTTTSSGSIPVSATGVYYARAMVNGTASSVSQVQLYYANGFHNFIGFDAQNTSNYNANMAYLYFENATADRVVPVRGVGQFPALQNVTVNKTVGSSGTFTMPTNVVLESGSYSGSSYTLRSKVFTGVDGNNNPVVNNNQLTGTWTREDGQMAFEINEQWIPIDVDNGIFGWAFKENVLVNEAIAHPPVITMSGGTATIAANAADNNATLFYSFDNTTFSQYTGPVNMGTNTIIYAYAQLNNSWVFNSEVVSEVSTAVAPPVITPDGGTFVESIDVTITCPTADATIWYMLNDGDPQQIENGGSFTLTETTTVTAWAEKGDELSDEVTATFRQTDPETTLDWILRKGTSGKVYTVKSDLAVVKRINTGTNTRDVFATDGMGNWIKIAFSGGTSQRRKFDQRASFSGSDNAQVKTTGTFTIENGNPVLALMSAPDEAEAVPTYSIRSFDLGDAATFFDPKPCEVIEFKGIYNAAENRFRGYSGANGGPRGRSCEIDLTYAANGSFEDGQQYWFKTDGSGNPGGAVILLKEAWSDGGRSGAQRIASNDPLAFQNYVLAPLSIPLPTAVSTLNAGKAVESVRYINVAGIESDKPFEGVNIVVKRYTDGTTSTAKVVK